MTDNEIRIESWKKAVEAEATKSVFLRRSKKYELITKLRDFVSLAVPILLAAIYGYTWNENYLYVKNWAIIALTVSGTTQLCLAAWSLISNWDSEKAYYLQSARENETIKTIWERIGKNNTPNIAVSFGYAQERQIIQDNNDVQKNISDSEMRFGMRRGLFLFKKSCAICGQVPTSRKPPLFPKAKCGNCGGN